MAASSARPNDSVGLPSTDAWLRVVELNMSNSSNSSNSSSTNIDYGQLAGYVILTLTTIVGNVIAIVAILTHPRLRSISNYYIASLAAADLLVGLCVMPMMAAWNILGYFPLETLVCDLWMSMDFVCCTTSFWNLCLISLDRYNSLRHPRMYKKNRGRKRALLLICLSWLLPALCWVPSIFVSRFFYGLPAVGDCEYITHPGFVLSACVAVYYIPMVTMLVLYARVLHELRAQMDKLSLWLTEDGVQLESPSSSMDFSSSINNGKTTGHSFLRISFRRTSLLLHNRSGSIRSETGSARNSLRSSLRGTNGLQRKQNQLTYQGSLKEFNSGSRRQLFRAGWQRNSMMMHGVHRNPDIPLLREISARKRQQQQKVRLRKQKRVARMLGCVILVFLLCWLPWCISWPIHVFCKECIPDIVFRNLWWPAYINSTINPFLYMFSNKDFRLALRELFRRLLRMKAATQKAKKPRQHHKKVVRAKRDVNRISSSLF